MGEGCPIIDGRVLSWNPEEFSGLYHFAATGGGLKPVP